MNRILLTAVAFFYLVSANAQGVTVQNSNPTSSIANRGSYIADSIFRLGTRDTVKPSWWNPSWSFNGAFQLGLDGNPYYYSGGKWNGFAGGSGGSGTVTSITQGYGMFLSPSPITTSGSVRVDTTEIVSKSFAANEYAPKSTTVTLTGLQNVYSKFMYFATLVSPTVSTLPLGSINDSLLVFNAATGEVKYISPTRIGGGVFYDSVLMATQYRLDTTRTNIYAQLVNKQNNSDTTTWDATKKNLADTSATLRALIGGGGVSAASVAEINTGTDNTKFASPLGLEGSKYVEQDGTKNYAVTTGTATAYVLATTPSFTPTTGTILYVRFHLANTGAATINVNGSGAVALQKDLSTALVANDIPINQEYTIRRTTTGWLIEDIGFAGINLSARLSGALSDETGTGVAVFGTTPTITTSILGSATFSAFNTVTTNLSFAGAATTFTEGGTPTTGLTATYFGNATASGQTKTLNFGTGGASGSITAINIGSSTSGATNNIRMNILPASDATGDIWYRNASGFMTRLGIGTTGQVLTVAAGLPSWATAGAGSGWGLTGNAGTNPSTNYVGTSDAQDFVGKANNVGLLRLTSGFSAVLGEYGTMIGASNTGLGYQTFINGASSFAAGTLAKSVGTSVFSFGWQADNSANHSMLFNCTGSTATNTTANHAKFVVPNGFSIESTTGMFVPPVMTATQAEAITTKIAGGIIYSTTGTGTFITTVGWWGWNGTAWEKLDP